ncbi:hypothetical protein LWI29_027238 [Acer saccharum]|uniref:Uncharacterized protein n=1 Tax=Acer saccharum TaxID=4024 RepID=A0AA39RR01_ACESA|nr:hypothetical protein LWI29_027238 [Acer saccharum]
MDAILELSIVCDSLNTTTLHTAASQGHIEVVNFLLEKGSSDSVVAIAKNSAKSALHSAARNGHIADRKGNQRKGKQHIQLNFNKSARTIRLVQCSTIRAATVAAMAAFSGGFSGFEDKGINSSGDGTLQRQIRRPRPAVSVRGPARLRGT